MGFGKKLEEKMLEKGLKQADLVRATGISKTTLSSMINRDNTKVDVESFIRICDVLGCAPEDFASEIPKKTQSHMNSVKITELSSQEQRLITEYRKLNDEGKEKAYERLSEMAQLEQYKKGTKYIYRVARSQNNTEPKIIEDTNGTIDKLKQIPPVTDKEDF